MGRAAPNFPPRNNFHKAARVMVGPVVMLVVILLFVGFLPTWPYSQDWGVGPSAILLLVLVVLLGVTLNGRL